MDGEKRKIVIAATSYLQFDRRLIRISASLVNANYSIVLIGRGDTNAKNSYHEAVDIKLIKTFFSSGIMFYAEYSFWLFFRLLWLKYDGIYSVDLDTLLPAALCAFVKNKKLLFDSHEFFTEVPELIGRKYVKAFWSRIGKIGITRSDVNITVNELLANSLEKKYVRRFTTIRNLPALHHQAKVANTGKRNTLIYLGVINRGRGISEVMKVLQLEPDLKLILIGKGDLYEIMKRKARSLGIEDRVIFTSWVDPQNIMNILMQADIGLNVLDPQSQSYRHSLANKTFDYIQAELPSVQMNFTTYRELNDIYETSILIEDQQPEFIREAINQLRFDDLLYKTLTDNCRRAKLEWNWEVEESKLIQAVQSMWS